MALRWRLKRGSDLYCWKKKKYTKHKEYGVSWGCGTTVSTLPRLRVSALCLGMWHLAGDCHVPRPFASRCGQRSMNRSATSLQAWALTHCTSILLQELKQEGACDSSLTMQMECCPLEWRRPEGSDWVPEWPCGAEDPTYPPWNTRREK